MADTSLRPLAGRFWRMLGVRWQRRPFESGAHLTGGRWNRPGTPALYLSADYNTAILEMHQNLIRPGTLVAYDVEAVAVANLARVDSDVAHCLWREIHFVRKAVPPTWLVADRLIADGADGAVVPSVQHPGGTNLVLWRWHDITKDGDGAALTLLDPERVLTGA